MQSSFARSQKFEIRVILLDDRNGVIRCKESDFDDPLVSYLLIGVIAV